MGRAWRSGFAPAALIAALAAAPGAAVLLEAPDADARTAKGRGGFRITVPAGWKVARPSGGVYRASCRSASVWYVRYRTSRTARRAGDALVRQLGLTVQRRRAARGSFSARLVKVSARGVVRREALALRKRGRTLTVRRWGLIEGRTGRCIRRVRRRARAAALIDDLATIAASAVGGVVGTLQIRRQERLLNPPVALRRFECSYRPIDPAIRGDPPTHQLGTERFVSALIPEAWGASATCGAGALQAQSFAGPLRGALIFGTVYNVRKPFGFGCLVPYDPNPLNPYNGGMIMAPFTPNPAAVVNNLAGPIINQLSLAAARGGPIAPLANFRVVQVLAAPWVGGASALLFVRYSRAGEGWNAIMSSSPFDTGDPCTWNWYTSAIAVPDNAVPGLGQSLIASWASWGQSFQSNDANLAQVAKNISSAAGQTDFVRRFGIQNVESFGRLVGALG